MTPSKFVRRYLKKDKVRNLIKNATTHHLKDDEYIDNPTYETGITLVEGGTGIGKTSHALESRFKYPSLHLIHVSVILPLVSLQVNKHHSHPDIDTHYGRGTNVYDAEVGYAGMTTMGTPESLLNMDKSIKQDTVAFVDEIQALVDAQAYRHNLAPAIESVFEEAKSVVLMSGTLYREALLPFVDRYTIYKKDTNQTRNVQLVIKGKDNHKSSVDMVRYLTQSIQKDTFMVILMENKFHITETINKLLADGWKEAEIISYVSHESTLTARNTPRAEEMIRTGQIPAEVKIMLWTSAALVGVDMRHLGGRKPFCIFNDVYNASPETIAQMCGRFRDWDELDCLVLLAEAAHKRNFDKKTTFSQDKAELSLVKALKEADEYYNHHKSTTGLPDRVKGLLLKDGEVSTLGAMKYIQNIVKGQTDHNEIYERFDIEVVDTKPSSIVFETNDKLDLIGLEDAILSANEVLPMESIEWKLEEPQKTNLMLGISDEVNNYIEARGNTNTNALNSLRDMSTVIYRFKNPAAYRYKRGKGKAPVTIGTLKNNSESFINRWTSYRSLRLSLAASDAWMTEAEVITLLKGCNGDEFPSREMQRRFIHDFQTRLTRKANVFKDIVAVETKRRQVKGEKERLYRFTLDQTELMEQLEPKWIEKKYVSFFFAKLGGLEAINNYIEDTPMAPIIQDVAGVKRTLIERVG